MRVDSRGMRFSVRLQSLRLLRDSTERGAIISTLHNNIYPYSGAKKKKSWKEDEAFVL